MEDEEEKEKEDRTDQTKVGGKVEMSEHVSCVTVCKG